MNENGNGEVEIVAPVIEAIRARRAEKARDRTFDIDVPGTKGMLVLRLGPIRGAAITMARERLERSKSPDREVNMQVDILIQACVGVWHRRTLDGPLEPLLADDGDPIRLDSRLAKMIGGFEARSAREVCFSLFDDANVPAVAIAAAAGEYMEWATSANEEMDDELVGESPVGAPSIPQASSPSMVYPRTDT